MNIILSFNTTTTRLIKQIYSLNHIDDSVEQLLSRLFIYIFP
jgi:hypothetical protein